MKILVKEESLKDDSKTSIFISIRVRLDIRVCRS